MYIFITVLIVIAAVILSILVLAQNSKGGGLAAGFSSSNQIMGVRRTTDFVEKATWGFAGGIIALSIAATFAMSTPAAKESAVKSEVENAFKVDPSLVNPNAQPAPQQ
ncbi:preprotein translocase subunit SecG [Bacteroidia bacterium]|nr:preprotein translocase subunit SecG [Bacteroidia bacterium]GHT57154.1 preprotein translocase subunit SecG [Bacteroidia bacterium]